MLFWGNAAAFLGCVLMVAIGFLKKKEQILVAQCVQFGFLALGNLLLGATAGAVSGAVSIVRNLVFSGRQAGTRWKVLFIGVQIALTALTWNGGLIECVPVLATVLFTWFLDTKSDVMFKIVIIGGQLLWTWYDWSYLNYVAFSFDLLTVASNLVGIAMIKKGK